MRLTLPPAMPMAPRFGTRSAKSFPYEKYADLMVNYSIGGVKPGELCLVKLGCQRLSEKSLKAIADLYRQGYSISVNPVPAPINRIISQSSMAPAYQALEDKLNAKYTFAVSVDNSRPKTPQLEALLKRPAQPGESIRITIETQDSDKLAEGVMRQIVSQGGVPAFKSGNIHLGDIARKYAKNDEQLRFVAPDIHELYGTMQKLVSISNPYEQEEDPKPKRILGRKGPRPGKAKTDLRKKLQHEAHGVIDDVYMQRMRRIEMSPDLKGGFFRTLGISPSKAVAKECGMKLEAFGRFYKAITKIDQADPVAYFREMDTIVGHYASQLQKFHQIRVFRDDGKTDVTFSIRDKDAVKSRYVAPSTATGNALPAEIFTSPVEDSVNGKLYLDIPFYLEKKNFQGLHLTFKDGKVIDLSVDKGDEALLKAMILEGHTPTKTVPGFNVLGEFAIGFNRKITELMKNRATRNTLIAEKQDLHFALGASYAVTGGKNKSPLHEDIPGRSGPGSGLHIQGWADGMTEPMAIYDEGRFNDDFLNYQTDVRVKNTEFFNA